MPSGPPSSNPRITTATSPGPDSIQSAIGSAPHFASNRPMERSAVSASACAGDAHASAARRATKRGSSSRSVASATGDRFPSTERHRDESE